MSGAAGPLSEAVHHVHVVGLGGKGMSAIAAALLDRGLTVSGSDLESSTYTEQLARRGAHVHIGHAAQQVHGADLVIHSAAVPAANPEIAEAQRRDIPLASRGEIVAALAADKSSIAIAGTHGKTTTSGMLATILHAAGYDPSFLIGANIPALGNVNGRLTASRWMVLEADEFDEAFLHYHPAIAVLTHLEPDHLEFFGSVERMVGAFARFVDGLAPNATLIVRTDIERLAALAARHRGPVIDFGTGAAWDIAAYTASASAVAFDLLTPHGPAVCRPAVPGRHNAWNGVAAIAAAVTAGVALPEAAQALGAYRGADRRFQTRAQAGGIVLIEDYAHHPTAVRVTIEAAREFAPERLWAIYQPLLAARTRDLFDDFLDAFEGADRVVLTEIFSPPGREPPIDISAARLADALHHPEARFLPTFDAVDRYLTPRLRAGDLVLVMGPESVTPLADRLSRRIEERAA